MKSLMKRRSENPMLSYWETRLNSITFFKHFYFTSLQTIPLSRTTVYNSFDCPNNSPLFKLDEYYPDYTLDHDGTIIASYPLNNVTVFEKISKDHYCIDSYDSSVLFCVPEPEDVCSEIVSSQVMSVRFSYSDNCPRVTPW